MEKKKVKVGTGANFIVGLTFIIIGVTFLPLGIVLNKVVENIEDKKIFLYTFGGLGTVFLIVGCILFISILNKKRKFQQLLDEGYYVIAQICEIKPNYAISINGNHPYVIHCKYEEINGNIHIFKTRNLFFNPEDLLKSNSVKVYTDRNNFKNYYVDIDEILPTIKNTNRFK